MGATPMSTKKARSMSLWKKAAGVIKDRNSILVSSLTGKTTMEVAVIKATSHDEYNVDYKNVKVVFHCLRTSSNYTKPLIMAISRRMERTRSWVVAIKGLMLMHGVFCCNVPAVQKLGRLPFDLSDFADGHSALSKAVCVNAFVRAYFAFLDEKSVFTRKEWSKGTVKLNEPVAQQLIRIDELQTLLDKLLLVKPLTGELMRFEIIIEAMNCMIIEIFHIYKCIYDGISRVLLRIYESGQIEATLALKILKRAIVQGGRLQEYFEFCKKHGILSAAEFPKALEISYEDIKELEQMIKGAPEKLIEMEMDMTDDNSKNLILRTIVTEKWEVFDEDIRYSNLDSFVEQQCGKETENEFTQKQLMIAPSVLPDLITF